MEEWIRSSFGILDVEWENVVYMVFDFDGKRIQIPIESFLNYTDGVSAPPSYKDLMAISPEDKVGWHPFFDDWYEKGLLN